MPLCEVCRLGAEVQPPTPDPPENPTPPYGMGWGQECDGCGRVAEVTIVSENSPGGDPR